MTKTIHPQARLGASPWSRRERAVRLLWECCWALLCSWTPKPCNGWRLFWLRRFGATLHGHPFVHQRARILIPWNLTMEDQACLGDGANAYTLGAIRIGARATVAQETYLCTGTHDFSTPTRELVTAPIDIGDDAFIGARAFIMPGVTIGRNAIVGACSVVTKSIADATVVAGNPARIMPPLTQE